MPNNTNLPMKEDEIPLSAILKLTIEEQRRVYDWLSAGCDQVRVKILTFLGGGLASLTFLYANGDLFIPPEQYGKIFYFFALAMVFFALALLIVSLKPLDWEFPTESKVISNLNQFKSHHAYLVYVKERYETCYSINVNSYKFKQKMFNYSLYPLIFGVIILAVLKLF